MRALVIFGSENTHPLAWMLNKRRRHVFCAVQTDSAWVVFDWYQGLPIITLAPLDYCLVTHYLDQGYEVVPYDRGHEPVMAPFVINNCVTAVKVLLGIKSWASTPHGLYRHLTEEPRSFWRWMSVPGFGGKKDGAALPPVQMTPPNGMELLSPGQKMLGEGHMRGQSPEDRAAAMSSVAAFLDGGAQLVPVMGGLYQAGTAVRDGDATNLAVGAFSAATGGSSRNLPILARGVQKAQAADQMGSAVAGASSRKGY
jgi:hypothetical protein